MACGKQKTVYACTACGKCCTWHGYVRMNDREIDRMAAYVGMTPDSFIQKYMTLTGDRRGLTLIERPNGHCIFLAPPARCTVYPVRPKQCRDFPNKWNFPGFLKECPSIPIRYKRIAISTPSCQRAYFPEKKAAHAVRIHQDPRILS